MMTGHKNMVSPRNGAQVRLPFPELADGGDLPNLPDNSGVYVLVCAFGGHSNYRLGDILYIGVSDSMRRRIAYALATPGRSAPHPAQEPLERFQSQRGVARVICCRLREGIPERILETALIVEYRRRTGSLPKWNKSEPMKRAIPAGTRLAAEELLDRLGVRDELGMDYA